jgi:DNA-binding XRE family transcriptional regulator
LILPRLAGKIASERATSIPISGYPYLDIVSSRIVASNVKKSRQKSGLSQDQLARKAGIPYSTYLKIESGYTPNPSIQAVLNIAEALGVSIDELVGRS